jgi:hypothetical protein
MAKVLPVGRGTLTTIVDDDTADALCGVAICGHKSWGVRLYLDGQKLYLHRWLTNAPPGMVVDHINGNRFDNRRENLRVVTQGENARNAPVRRDCTSRYRGVLFCRTAKRWMARVKKNGITYHLGLFNSVEEAAVEAQKKRRELGFPMFREPDLSHLRFVPTPKDDGLTVNRRNSTGVRGVTWDKGRQMYRVDVTKADRGHRYCGHFESLDEAKEVAFKARRDMGLAVGAA